MKILFFTSGNNPTAAELAAIDRLNQTGNQVGVRNGAVPADTLFGENIEQCDAVAGTKIPAAYTDSPASKPVIATPSTSDNPDQFKVFPATLSLDNSDVDKMQLAALSVKKSTSTGLATATDLAADNSVVWSTSDGTKATVGGDGLVTAAGTGSCTITATLTTGTLVTGITAEADDDILTKTGHPFQTGDALLLKAVTGATGLVDETAYWAIRLGANTFKLASSYANAIAGTAINITTDGTGIELVPAPLTSTCAVTVVA